MSRLDRTIKQVKQNNKYKAVTQNKTYSAFKDVIGEIGGLSTCRHFDLYGHAKSELRYSLVMLILGGVTCLDSTH